MEPPHITVLPVDPIPAGDVELEHLLAAIDLVAQGVAVRVVVANVGGIDEVASAALAAAQAAGVRFGLARGEWGVRAIVGPLEG